MENDVKYLVQRQDRNGLWHTLLDETELGLDILFLNLKSAQDYRDRYKNRTPNYEYRIVGRVTTEFEVK